MNIAAFLWHRIQDIKYILYQEVICYNFDPIHHPPNSIRKQMKLSKQSRLIEVRNFGTERAETLIKGASQPYTWSKGADTKRT